MSGSIIVIDFFPHDVATAEVLKKENTEGFLRRFLGHPDEDMIPIEHEGFKCVSSELDTHEVGKVVERAGVGVDAIVLVHNP